MFLAVLPGRQNLAEERTRVAARRLVFAGSCVTLFNILAAHPAPMHVMRKGPELRLVRFIPVSELNGPRSAHAEANFALRHPFFSLLVRSATNWAVWTLPRCPKPSTGRRPAEPPSSVPKSGREARRRVVLVFLWRDNRFQKNTLAPPPLHLSTVLRTCLRNAKA